MGQQRTGGGVCEQSRALTSWQTSLSLLQFSPSSELWETTARPGEVPSTVPTLLPPCSSFSRQRGLPTATNGYALAGKVPRCPHHRPRPRIVLQALGTGHSQQGAGRNRVSRASLSPSPFPKSHEKISTGLPFSICPHIQQLECAKLYTEIACSVPMPLLAEPRCLAQQGVQGPGQPQGRAVSCPAAVSRHQQPGLLYTQTSCSSC